LEWGDCGLPSQYGRVLSIVNGSVKEIREGAIEVSGFGVDNISR
jgi:hypothetical protein